MNVVHEVCKVVLVSLVSLGLVALLSRGIVRRWRQRQDPRTSARIGRIQEVLFWSGASLGGMAWIVDALGTGETSLKHVVATRANEPILYWLIIAVAAVPAASGIVVLVLGRKKQPGAYALLDGGARRGSGRP